jgi:hypothetical protein
MAALISASGFSSAERDRLSSPCQSGPRPSAWRDKFELMPTLCDLARQMAVAEFKEIDFNLAP